MVLEKFEPWYEGNFLAGFMGIIDTFFPFSIFLIGMLIIIKIAMYMHVGAERAYINVPLTFLIFLLLGNYLTGAAFVWYFFGFVIIFEILAIFALREQRF